MSQRAHPILVIEDDPDLLLMLATALELEGQRVVTAANGIDAFRLAQLHRPALIVLDLMLPVMSGEDFRRKQLASEALKDIPVLVVSARYDAPAIAERIRAIGCMTKPVDLETFAALVKAVLSSAGTADRDS
jgi:two-component system sensor histidine kinase ChiS